MSTFNSTITEAGRYCFQQQRDGRDRRLHTHPQRRELHSTAIDDVHASPSLLQSSMYDGSVTGWDQDLFPTSKRMKSHVRPRSPFQSPAKVFSKLKASVGRNTGGMKTYEKDGSVLPTTSEGAANTQEAKLMTNETSTFDPIGAEAMIIYPTKSPQHKPTKSFLHCTKYRVPSPIRDTRHGLIKRNEYTPVKNPGQVTQQVPLSHKSMTLRSSKNVFRTPAIGQPQQLIHYESGGRPIIEAMVCLERCPLNSPAKMFAYFKRSERKKAFLFPQKTAHGKKDVRMELSDDESQHFSPAEPSESDLRSIDEPTNSPVGNDVNDDLSPPARCPMVLNNLWLHDSEKALVSKRRHRVQSWKRPASPDLKRVEAEYGTNMDRLLERKDNCFQSAATFESCRKDDSPIPARTSLLVLAEDTLINQSPCVSIPQINNPIRKRKPAPLEPIQPKQILVQKGSGCELAKWTIKYNREGLYVDGIRTSDNTPWHSTIIVKRISADVLRTLSGKIYTLIGPMNMHESSKFPNWLLMKFVHGFPPDWKKHFKRFLLEKDAASSSADIFPQGPGATKNAEKQSSTPFVTPSCPPPSSGVSSLAMKRSRCGRLLKPPLQFWKGGRVILDQSMNVTIMEDYENTVCMTKSFTLPPILEPEPPKLHGGLPQRRREATLPSQETGRPLVDQWQSSGPSVLRRKAKSAGPNRRAKTHASPEASVFPPEEEGRGQGAGSSSPEEQEPRARRGTEQRRLVLQAGRLAHRPDPRQRSDNDAPEGRIALPREQKIPVSKKPTLAHGSPASTSDEDIPVRKKAGCQGMYQRVLSDSLSSTSLSSMEGSLTLPRKDMGKTVTRTDKGKGRAGSPEIAPDPLSSPAQPSRRGGRPKAVFSPAQPSKRGDGGSVPKAVSSPAQPSKRGDSGTVPKAVSSPAQPSKRGDSGTAPKRGILQEEKVDWTEAELKNLKIAIASLPKHMGRYWVNVAMMVGTRSPEDCQTQHNFQESVKASSKNARVSGKKMDPPADQAPPAITARVGTLMRKQQVRQFMEAMPKEDNDDVFSSTAMQGKCFQMPSMSPSGMEQGFVLSDLEPTTPRGSSYCTAKTPSGLHISPGMIRSVNRKKDDNYIYQLQKRMKRSQVNACKLSPPTKTFPLKPSVKRDDTSFEIWETFPDNRGAQDDDSGEEQDDYFSDSD
ncbi:mis18-binding protein 1 [Gadus morhua]|uniref:SANTA domain-containing protein n=1 Tax=Gadus morhua TaxID=8049 RepID=A0A8C5CDN2_GADMO|nr:mis18-binding protein 1 [Gadus morhua]